MQDVAPAQKVAVYPLKYARVEYSPILVMIRRIHPRFVGILRLALGYGLISGAVTLPPSAVAQSVLSSVEPASYEQVIDQADRLPKLRSLLLSIDGQLVIERYLRGAKPTQWANVKSVSKSVLSTLVGIALDRGYLDSVREPIEKFFPDYVTRADHPAKKTITIEDLLTMRSGLETTSNRNYGRWVRSNDWVRHVLSRPMVDKPGGRMIYSTGNSHLLSALLTRATRTSTFDFARRYLAHPLGIEIRPWARDPQGIYFGGNEMHLTPRAMLAIGRLYLNRGRADGKPVVSEAWVRESLLPRTRSRRSGREYGYGWWIDTLGKYQAYSAWGHGGQFIFVVPELKMVVVTTSAFSRDRQERRRHRRGIYELLEEYLVPVANRTATKTSKRAAHKPATSLAQYQP